ncbi:hypothetical protein K2Y11_16675 [bacterium]|nr:hypothetical protein [bacterium]
MRGRPPKSPEDKKTQTFRFRVSDEERDRIEQKAKECGESASAWVRRIILAASDDTAQQKKKPPTTG